MMIIILSLILLLNHFSPKTLNQKQEQSPSGKILYTHKTMEKQPVKTIVVKSDGPYVSHLVKPIEPYYEHLPMYDTADYYLREEAVEQYEKELSTFTSSLIKVENEGKFSLELIAHAFDFYGNITNQDERGKITYKESTYPAPDGLVMEVKTIYGEGSTVKDIRGERYATCSFLPDKEEEKEIKDHFAWLTPEKAERLTRPVDWNKSKSELKEDVGEEKGDDELITAIKEHLAVVHRDGGHYTAKHGLLKSIEDATKVYWEFRKRLQE